MTLRNRLRVIREVLKRRFRGLCREYEAIHTKHWHAFLCGAPNHGYRVSRLEQQKSAAVRDASRRELSFKKLSLHKILVAA